MSEVTENKWRGEAERGIGTARLLLQEGDPKGALQWLDLCVGQLDKIEAMTAASNTVQVELESSMDDAKSWWEEYGKHYADDPERLCRQAYCNARMMGRHEAQAGAVQVDREDLREWIAMCEKGNGWAASRRMKAALSTEGKE